VQGVGQPTTWVYARDRSAGAILDAVRAGRTFIADEPPGLAGPTIHLRADEKWPGGGQGEVGGSVGALGPLDIKVHSHNSAGSRLRIVASGKVVADELVTSPVHSRTFSDIVLAEDGWVRAELFVSESYFMTALTSPVYATGLAPAGVRRPASTGPAATYGDPGVTAADRRRAAAGAVRGHHRCGC
jgi:hypothetical protein